MVPRQYDFSREEAGAAAGVSGILMMAESPKSTGGGQCAHLTGAVEAALWRRKWKYRLISAGIRVVVYALIMWGLFRTDKAVAFFVHDQLRPPERPALEFIAVFGRAYASRSGLLALAVFVLLADWRRGWRAVAAGAVLLLITAGVTEVGKETVDRVRPEKMIFEQKGGSHVDSREQGQRSFPSGHATAAFSLYATACRYYPGVSPLFLFLAVVCGVSRVLMGKHYPSDVFAGALIGYYLSKWLVRSPILQWVRLAPRPAQKQSGGGDSC